MASSTPAPPPDLPPEHGWSEISPFPGQERLRNFVGDRIAPDDRLAIRYFLDEEGILVGKVWFGPGAQGPPGYAHGGSIAAVLDAAMGAAPWAVGMKVLAVRLNIELNRAVPLDSILTFRAPIAETEGRKITVTGTLTASAADGSKDTLHASGEGLFIHLTDDHLKNLRDLL